MKSIIIGIGNPLLKDDGVGIQVVREIKEQVKGIRDLDVIELYHGGMALMEAMLGYERAFVVDAMITGDHKPGTVRPFMPSEIVTTRHAVSTHDTDLSSALEVGRLLHMPLPEDIRIWGVEAREVDIFSEQLSEEVAAAVPRLVEVILQELTAVGGRCG